jgi:hypothetical protein
MASIAEALIARAPEKYAEFPSGGRHDAELGINVRVTCVFNCKGPQTVLRP